MLESRPRVSPSPHHGRETPPARRDVTEARPPLLHKACHVTRTGTVWQFRPLALLQYHAGWQPVLIEILRSPELLWALGTSDTGAVCLSLPVPSLQPTVTRPGFNLKFSAH